MLLTHVQAALNTDGTFHIQATGPSFPKGYASGDVGLAIKPDTEVFIPSMRGSGRLYFKLNDAQVEANLTAIVSALCAPRPAYSTADVTAVAERVTEALAYAAKGPAPKVVPVAPTKTSCDIDEDKVAKIVKAVLAILQA